MLHAVGQQAVELRDDVELRKQFFRNLVRVSGAAVRQPLDDRPFQQDHRGCLLCIPMGIMETTVEIEEVCDFNPTHHRAISISRHDILQSYKERSSAPTNRCCKGQRTRTVRCLVSYLTQPLILLKDVLCHQLLGGFLGEVGIPPLFSLGTDFTFSVDGDAACRPGGFLTLFLQGFDCCIQECQRHIRRARLDIRHFVILFDYGRIALLRSLHIACKGRSFNLINQKQQSPLCLRTRAYSTDTLPYRPKPFPYLVSLGPYNWWKWMESQSIITYTLCTNVT
jgi:hypothetical protein